MPKILKKMCSKVQTMSAKNRHKEHTKLTPHHLRLKSTLKTHTQNSVSMKFCQMDPFQVLFYIGHYNIIQHNKTHVTSNNHPNDYKHFVAIVNILP